MILKPAPLQRPAGPPAPARPARAGFNPAPRTTALARPVLQTPRVPLQLCLDLQPRLR
jgi:hypothetical protein